MYRTNLFARHNLFLATPVMPLASPACDSARPQDLVQPQTKPLRAYLLTTDNPSQPSQYVLGHLQDRNARWPNSHINWPQETRKPLPREVSEASISQAQILRRSL